MNYSIEFLDCKNNFKISKKTFKTYKEAFNFMLNTFDTINIDLIIKK